MFKKILSLLPFLILIGISINTLGLFLTDRYIANWHHCLAFALLVVNAGIYFIRFRFGVLATGILLVLAIFNVIVLWPWTDWFAVLELPLFNWRSMGLFVLYFLLNFNMLMNWYLDVKEARQSR